MGGLMFVNMRGNPVSRDEYQKLLQRVIALEEKYGRWETEVDSGKRNRQRDRVSGQRDNPSENAGA